MRRTGLLVAALLGVLVACGRGGSGGDPAQQAEPAPGRAVPPDFFGMHVEQPFLQDWPTVPFTTVRAWGTYPDVSWRALHLGPGRFDWRNLDAYVDNALAHDQEVVYVFGHVPAWVSSDPTGDCAPDPVASCFPPDVGAWREFVTAVTDRYRGRIASWELWNEPDAENFWRGSEAELVRLAEVAYPIVRAAGGQVLSPSPQGTQGPAWTRRYLEAGGAPYADVNAFHSYLYAAPETLLPLVEELRAVYADFGIEDRPLWDTEHSWGEPDSPFGGTQELQAAWLARFLLLSVDVGIDRSIWYGWEHTGWGTLVDKDTQQVTAPGVAYGEVHAWLQGATMSPCTTRAEVHRCGLSRPDGEEAVAVWSSGDPAEITVPEGSGHYRTVAGDTVEVDPGSRLVVGAAPYLLER